VTEVIAEETYFADSKKGNSESSTDSNPNTNNGQPGGFFPMDSGDDELPF